MRVTAWVMGLCVLGFARVASAQAVPAERVGFQMAVRTGYALPMGDVEEGVGMDDFVSGQLPLFVEIGGKVSRHVFIGGYLGLSFGGPNGETERLCDAFESCLSVGVRLGAEVQYHILPAGSVNPWLGYGIGLESLAVALQEGGENATFGYGGYEYARLSAGLDFRLTRGFGLGPFIDFSVGEYTSIDTDTSQEDEERDVQDGAAHQWLTLGVRAVIFP